MTEQNRQTWLDRLYDLRRDNPSSQERPHKPVLLLAIMDLLDRGLVADNRIPLNDDLVKAFRRYFEVVRQHDDKPPRPGREEGAAGVAPTRAYRAS